MINERTLEMSASENLKLSAHTWATTDCYAALGRKFMVRSTSDNFAVLVRRLMRSFLDCEETTREPDVTFSLVVASPLGGTKNEGYHYFYRNDDLVRKTKDYWKLIRILEWQLSVFLTEEVIDFVLLHSGAVAKDGAGIILPGSSRSGKSSLTMTLLLRGYDYLSDEIAVIATSTGKVCPFPKPLSCRDISLFPELVKKPYIWFGPRKATPKSSKQESGSSTPVWFAHSEDIRSGSIGSSMPIKYIIFPTHTPGDTCQLQPISKGRAMRGLINHTVNFHRLGKNGLKFLGRMVGEAESFTLVGSGLQATSNLITQLVEG